MDIFQIQDHPLLVVVGSSLPSNDQCNSFLPNFKLSPLSSFLVPNPIFVGAGFVTHRANWLIFIVDTFLFEPHSVGYQQRKKAAIFGNKPKIFLDSSC